MRHIDITIKERPDGFVEMTTSYNEDSEGTPEENKLLERFRPGFEHCLHNIPNRRLAVMTSGGNLDTIKQEAEIQLDIIKASRSESK